MKLKSQIGNIGYLNEIDDIGRVENATTREEVVNYFITTTSPYLATALRYMNDSIRFPTFDEDELNDEIEVVIGEIDRNEANPFFYLNRTMSDKLYLQISDAQKSARHTRNGQKRDDREDETDSKPLLCAEQFGFGRNGRCQP